MVSRAFYKILVVMVCSLLVFSVPFSILAEEESTTLSQEQEADALWESQVGYSNYFWLTDENGNSLVRAANFSYPYRYTFTSNSFANHFITYYSSSFNRDNYITSINDNIRGHITTTYAFNSYTNFTCTGVDIDFLYLDSENVPQFYTLQLSYNANVVGDLVDYFDQPFAYSGYNFVKTSSNGVNYGRVFYNYDIAGLVNNGNFLGYRVMPHFKISNGATYSVVPNNYISVVEDSTFLNGIELNITNGVGVNAEVPEYAEQLGGIQGLLKKIKDFLSNIKESVTNGFSNVSSWLSNLGDRISTFFVSLGDRISTFFSNLGDRISDFFTTLKNWIWWGNANGEADYQQPTISNSLLRIINWVNEKSNSLSDAKISIQNNTSTTVSHISTFTTFYNSSISAFGSLTVLLSIGIVFLLVRKVVGR